MLKKSRTTVERKKNRWLVLLILVAVFCFLGYFDFLSGPVVVSTVVL